MVGSAIVGALLGVGTLFVGPKDQVACTEASWPDSMFGDMFGHVDGATYTGCYVPSGPTWTIALVILLGFVTIGAIAARAVRQYSPQG